MRIVSGVALVVLLTLAACSKANEPAERPCASADECTNPAEPYCVDSVCHACNGPSACTPDAPRCTPEELVCGGCVGDRDCTAYPSMPRCSTTDGACVGCVDDSQCMNPFPTCDPDGRACRGCEADSECPSSICDRASGACIDEALALYASPAGTANEPCTRDAPCTVAKAIELAGAERPVVRLAPADYSLGGIVVSGKAFTLYGFDSRFVVPAAADEAISVRDGAVLAIRGLTIVSTTGVGIEVRTTVPTQPAPSVDLDQVRFEGMQPYHLNVLHGSATVARSQFVSQLAVAPLVVADGNQGRIGDITIRRSWFEGGLALLPINGGKIHVVNSVWKNVADGAFKPLYGGSGDVAFSTFVDSPIDCGLSPTPVVAMSNNVVFASGVENVVQGTACLHRYSIFYPQTAEPAGANNLRADPRLRAAAAGDYHLDASSPAIDAADPAASVSEDHDGTGRPQGGARDMGAFEHKP